MPVLFITIAESWAPSLYASTASWYIFLAMKMSPRNSGVIRFADFGGTADACPVRDSATSPLDGGVACAKAAGTTCVIAKVTAESKSLETITGILDNIGCCAQNIRPGRHQPAPSWTNPRASI